jgi:hypothetical protein
VQKPPLLLVLFVAIATVSLVAAHSSVPTANHKTQNIIFVMTDGLRWQELFRGADPALMNKELGGVTDIPGLKQRYWRENTNDRRALLMPFVWNVIDKGGQIFGNRDRGSEVFVTNGFNFSYPGYSETLCRFPDSRINSNDKVPNPNVTVLEWLNKKPAYRGKVAAFGAWDVFPAIFNAARAGFPVNAGYQPFDLVPGSARLDLLNHLKAETPHIWEDEPFDSIPFYTSLEYLKARQPKVLYLSLGETDDWAHAGNYNEYLNAAHRVDDYLALLWKTVQSMPAYQGKTTLIFSPDHGRGELGDWKSHGQKIPDSKYIWMAFLGPDTPALGERSHIAGATQSQLAATLAALLGEDYHSPVPQSGKPLMDVVPH